MAVEETRQLYDPQLTGSRTALLTSVDKLGAGLASQLRGYTGLDTSKYAPEIADQTALQKGLAGQAKGLSIFSWTRYGITSRSTSWIY
jgi:hypothetical protein